jgi:hypothetical protein
LSPNDSTHDWHVQPICQRPNRLPPERRVFSPERTFEYRAFLPTLLRVRLSSKPLKATRSGALLSTHCAHRISTCFAQAGKLYTSLWSLHLERDRTRLPLLGKHAPEKGQAFSARAEAEAVHLEKDRLEVLAKKAKPFEDPCPRI